MSDPTPLHVHGTALARFLDSPAAREAIGDRPVVVLDSEDDFIAAVSEIELLFGFRMPKGHWGDATKLRFIQIPGAGVDNVIDEPDLDPAVVICNASGSHEPEMPEFVMAMLHALVYHVPRLADQQREHRWRITVPQRSLTGSRLCILGLGAIGQSVARRAEALGMEVVGVRNSGAETPHVTTTVTPDRRLEVIRGADALVVIVPLTPDTVGLVGATELDALAPGAVVVDVSRGGIVDLDALTERLADDRLGGAAVDVFEEEPLPADSPYWDAPGLLITPHTAGWSTDYADRIVHTLAENLRAFEEGRTPPGVVDRSLGY